LRRCKLRPAATVLREEVLPERVPATPRSGTGCGKGGGVRAGVDCGKVGGGVIALHGMLQSLGQDLFLSEVL